MDSEQRTRLSEIMKTRWADPKQRIVLENAARSPERRQKIQTAKLGSKNPMWKGINASLRTAREYAERHFSLRACSIVDCLKKAERHHVDGNPHNNDPNNIRFLCRKHHMKEDGRLCDLQERNIFKAKRRRLF